jgi:hypothetical protein
MKLIYLLASFVSLMALQANTPTLVDRIQSIDPNNFYDELMKGSEKNTPLKTDLQVKKLTPLEQEALKKKLEEVCQACYKKTMELESQKKELFKQSDFNDRVEHGIIGGATTGLLSLIALIPIPKSTNIETESIKSEDLRIILGGIVAGGLLGFAFPTNLDFEKMNINEKFYENSKCEHAAASLALVMEKKLSENQIAYYALLRAHTYPWEPIDGQLYKTLEVFAQNNK